MNSGPMVWCRNCRPASLSILHNFGELPLGGLLPTPVLGQQAPRFVTRNIAELAWTVRRGRCCYEER